MRWWVKVLVAEKQVDAVLEVAAEVGARRGFWDMRVERLEDGLLISWDGPAP
jgi:hypothetical protein